MNTKILNRLRRLEGQVRALSAMIGREETCEKTIVQFQAAKAAMEGVYALYLEESLTTCLKNNDMNRVGPILKNISKK